MSKPKTTSEIRTHKKDALKKIDAYMSALIDSKDPQKIAKADKLSYWLENWSDFLDFEPNFSPLNLRRYKRGEVIKVHLGFNIGSEEGGLHYAVVLDKENPKSSPVVTIVPLTSVKPNTDVTNLKSGSLFLGNELFTNLSAKFTATHKHLQEEIAIVDQVLDELKKTELTQERINALNKQMESMKYELGLLQRMRVEVNKMKIGSIALVNQITTISKIRIYDPKTDHDILSNIKLSNEKLDMIDQEIIKKYTK